MMQNPTSPAYLIAEALRCERLALGVSDPDLVDCLQRWAAEYRWLALAVTLVANQNDHESAERVA